MAYLDGDLLDLFAFAQQLGSFIGAAPEAVPLGGWAAALSSAIAVLQPLGGGTIFFRPGRYLVVADELVVPEAITLWFSPGAVIDPRLPPPAAPGSVKSVTGSLVSLGTSGLVGVPIVEALTPSVAARPRGVLVIRGAIRAAPHMIFFPSTSRAWLRPGATEVSSAGPGPGAAVEKLPGSVTPTFDLGTDIDGGRFRKPGLKPGDAQSIPTPGERGEVILTSGRIEEVYPEWWGAGVNDEEGVSLDADAIEAALRAAWANRWSEAVNGVALAALRVVMPGRYTLARGARVQPMDRRAPHPDAVCIEGRAAGPGTKTLSADARFPTSQSLLEIA